MATNTIVDVLAFYIVKGYQQGSVIGYPSASKLSLIQVVCEVTTKETGNHVENIIPELFKGIGEFQEVQTKVHVDTWCTTCCTKVSPYTVLPPGKG